MAAVNDVPKLVDKREAHFTKKTAEGDAKSESQWTLDERRVVDEEEVFRIGKKSHRSAMMSLAEMELHCCERDHAQRKVKGVDITIRK
ncbi:hypothetical protein Tco_0396853 [Tanacetum coccineum]